MKKYSRLRAVIDLDAVMYNMEMMHANIEKWNQDGRGHQGQMVMVMERCRFQECWKMWTMSGAMRSQLWMKVLYSEKAGIQKPILFAWDVFLPGPAGRDDPS